MITYKCDQFEGSDTLYIANVQSKRSCCNNI